MSCGDVGGLLFTILLLFMSTIDINASSNN